MAEISKIVLPNGKTYDIKDTVARELASGGIHFIGITTDTAIADGYSVTKDSGSGETYTITLTKYSESNSKGTNDPLSNASTTETHTVVNGDMVIKGNKEYVCAITHEDSGNIDSLTYTWHEFGDISTLGNLAKKNEVVASYTPAGEISQPTFTGKNATITSTGSYTPAGTTASIFTGTKATISGSTSYTPAGKITNTPTTSTVTMPTLATSVSGETLTLRWTAGTAPSSVVTGVTSTFAGTAATVAISSSYTPTGSVASTFTGTAATISTSVSYTPAGTVSKPTFAGTAATITSK